MQPVINTVMRYISPHKVRLSDFIDQCSCSYTPLLLAIFVFITGTIDTFGKPINCMIPAEFSSLWASFVHQYCYVTGTYVKTYPHGQDGAVIPVYVDYYQWVPFVLMMQAIAMRLPHFIWSLGQTTSDIDFYHIHAICAKARNEGTEKRVKDVENAAIAIYEVAKRRNFKGLGNLTAYLYILFKLMNIAMVIAQISFLNSFVGYNNPFWGITLARNTWNNNAGTNWQNDFTYFPRVAYCTFSRDFLGHYDGGLTQETRCAIGINILNEKVFLILYFWYYILLAMTIIGAVYPILFSFGRYQEVYVHGFLTMVNREDVLGAGIGHLSTGNGNVKLFREKILGMDGLLLLRFVHHNAGSLIASELCSRLYHICNNSIEMKSKQQDHV